MQLFRLNPIAMALSGFLLSHSLMAQIFFPQNISDLADAINTSNTDCEDDLIYLGGLTFTFTNTSLGIGENALPIITSDGSTDCPDVYHTLTIQEGTITRSTALGTALFRFFEVSVNATLSLDGVTLSNGNVNDYGGAILVDTSYPSNGNLALVNNSTFINNTALGGGAIAIEGSAGIISNSTFTGNSSTGSSNSLFGGGAIILVFPDTQATSDVGALELDGPCTLNLLTSSTFSNNTSTSTGGAIAVFGCAIDVISDSTFTANSATIEGGAIEINEGAVATIANSTIALNSSATQGGGIDINSGNLGNLVSTIVATNTAPTGPDVYVVPASGGLISLESFNLIGNNSGSTIVAGNPNPDNSIVGTTSSPINPLLGPLQNNGGPTQTMAINAGANPLALLFDQRGPFFFRVSGPQADIGAYELQLCEDCDDDDENFVNDDDSDDDGGYIEDDGFGFGGDIGPFGPPPPMAVNDAYGNWGGGYQGQGLPADAPIASGQAGLSGSMHHNESPGKANKTNNSSVVAPENSKKDASYDVNIKEAEEHEPVSRKKSSGCSLIDGPGQAASNTGLLFAIILYGLRMLKRRKSLNC
jgi:predicted outer membrane repeat protein